MAYKRNTFWSGLGQKVKQGVQLGAGIKTAFDVGKFFVNTVKSLAPVVSSLAPTALALLP